MEVTDEEVTPVGGGGGENPDVSTREDMDDEIDLSWSAVMKRTFEAYLREERPNMYGEWISWERGVKAK